MKIGKKVRLSIVNILVGAKSYTHQIWWEIQLWITGVYPRKELQTSRGKDRKVTKEEDEGESRVGMSEWEEGSMCNDDIQVVRRDVAKRETKLDCPKSESNVPFVLEIERGSDHKGEMGRMKGAEKWKEKGALDFPLGPPNQKELSFEASSSKPRRLSASARFYGRPMLMERKLGHRCYGPSFSEEPNKARKPNPLLLNRKEPLPKALYAAVRSPTLSRKGDEGMEKSKAIDTKMPSPHQDRYNDSFNKGAQNTSSSSPSTFSFDRTQP